MSTVATPHDVQAGFLPSDNPTVRAIDRWIYVFMAAFFIVVTLAGFIPDSLVKIAAVEAGERPPFPLVLHFHSVLMGCFLLLLLAQTTLAATGRQAYHQQLGLAAVVLVPALVIVGFILVPTRYHQVSDFMQIAPAEAKAAIQQGLRQFENIMLMQIRIGVLFPLLIGIALMARKTDPGLHKRMMFLGTVMALPAAIDRLTWLPHTLPESPLSPELYMLLAVSPMLIWDLVRSRTVHKAYLMWLGILLPTSILTHSLWDTDWWHGTAQRLVGA